jgi:hypothetical protein
MAIALKPDAGPPPLFGPLVAMGQGITLAALLNENAANADKYVDQFCEGTKKLQADHPAGGDPGTQSDAAQFMAPLMDYEKPLDEPPGKLHLAQPFRDRISGYHQDWPTLITDQDLAGLDFSWLTALQQFDHWSLFGAGRLRDVAPGNSFEDPIPNYSSLLYWTRLRYALALRKGDLAQASSDVLHLANLIRSQALLLGDMVAVALVRQDAHMRASVLASGGDVSRWPAPDVNELQSYRQLDFASIYFTYPGVSEATLRKAVDCMPSLCTALNEGAAANHAIGAYVDADNLELIASLSQQHGCDPGSIERARKSQQLSPLDALTSAVDSTLGVEIPTRLQPPPPQAP